MVGHPMSDLMEDRWYRFTYEPLDSDVEGPLPRVPAGVVSYLGRVGGNVSVRATTSEAVSMRGRS